MKSKKSGQFTKTTEIDKYHTRLFREKKYLISRTCDLELRGVANFLTPDDAPEFRIEIFFQRDVDFSIICNILLILLQNYIMLTRLPRFFHNPSLVQSRVQSCQRGKITNVNLHVNS